MSTIKTRYGYFTISNTYVTWYFYEQAAPSAMTAYMNGEIDTLDSLSVLKLDKDGLKLSSNWPNEVTNPFSLANRIKRDRIEATREEA